MNKDLWRRVAPFLIVVAVALGVRLSGLDREAFHIDEIYSSQFSAAETQKILRLNAKDVHPPLYTLLLAEWRKIFGSTRWDHRTYSVLWSILGLGALGLLAHELTRSRGATTLVMALAAVHPLDVFYAQEARMYPQLGALATFSSWILWRWMAAPARSKPHQCWFWAAGYTVAAVAILYTHYLGLMVLLAQGIFAIVFFSRHRRLASLAGYIGCAVASAVAFLPWLNFVRGLRGELYSHEHLLWIPVPRIADVAGILSRELVWGNAPLRAPWSLVLRALSTIVVIGAAWLIVRSASSATRPTSGPPGDSQQLRVVYPVWLLFGPVILAVVVSFVYHPVFYPPRFSTLVLAPFLVLAGQAFEQLPRGFSRSAAALVVGLLMVSATIVQTTVVSRRGMYDFAALWESAGPPAAVVFFPSFKAKEASHYVGTKIRSARRARIEEIAGSGTPSVIWVCVHRGSGGRLRAAEEKYRTWLLGFGTVKKVATVDNLDVFAVSVATREATPQPVSRELRRQGE